METSEENQEEKSTFRAFRFIIVKCSAHLVIFNFLTGKLLIASENTQKRLRTAKMGPDCLNLTQKVAKISW